MHVIKSRRDKGETEVGREELEVRGRLARKRWAWRGGKKRNEMGMGRNTLGEKTKL